MELLKYTIIGSLLMLFACTSPPDYPIEPVLEYKSVSKPFMTQSSIPTVDSVVINFTFTDGDGDIGEETNTEYIFLTDTRTGFVDNTFSLPLVPVQGVGNGISGEVSIIVQTTCCIFPDGGPPPCEPSTEFPTDELIYEIYMVDRAGNKSNIIRTEPIQLLCN